MITYDDFAKVEIRAGKILSAEKVPETDKLLRLSVDFGIIIPPAVVVTVSTEAASDAPVEIPVEAPVPVRDIRQIVSGISAYFPEPSVLVGKTCMFVTNLEPRKIKGLESNGMLFALSTPGGAFSLLEPGAGIPEGTRAH
jgi:methionyl-tRNA synthetase